MNWLPIKHTLTVNRTRAGTFSLELRPDMRTGAHRFRADADGPSYREALAAVERRVREIRSARDADKKETP